MQGRVVQEIAEEWGLELLDAAARLMPGRFVYHFMDEADVRRFTAHPRAMIGSDGSMRPTERNGHPRTWGTFPRVIGRYCRDLGLMDLETAIHKMTGLTANTYRMKDRGVLCEGNYADIVMFDFERIIDNATYEDPVAISQGIEEVWVNGVSTYVGGSGATGESAGRIVTRNSP